MQLSHSQDRTCNVATFSMRGNHLAYAATQGITPRKLKSAQKLRIRTAFGDRTCNVATFSMRGNHLAYAATQGITSRKSKSAQKLRIRTAFEQAWASSTSPYCRHLHHEVDTVIVSSLEAIIGSKNFALNN